MPRTIEWREKDGVAIHAAGPSFWITRTGWVTVADADGWSDEALLRLIAELHSSLASVAQPDEPIH